MKELSIFSKKLGIPILVGAASVGGAVSLDDGRMLAWSNSGWNNYTGSWVNSGWNNYTGSWVNSGWNNYSGGWVNSGWNNYSGGK